MIKKKEKKKQNCEEMPQMEIEVDVIEVNVIIALKGKILLKTYQ